MPGSSDPLPQLLNAGILEPYIRYIRFPRFRNLRDGLRINFDYPVTALVGPNGTNKTAILRALQGCPDYYNVGQYWFSTNLDPISPEERHRFIHGYIAQTTGEIVEVIKTRITRKQRRGNKGIDPDYFEPSRPLIQDGMERPPPLPEGIDSTPDRVATRWKAITKDVVYLDFRQQLSAFDKYFYEIPYDAHIKTLTDKKDFIRRRSDQLAATLSSGRQHHRWYERERVHNYAELDASQLEDVSKILGRKFEEITVIQHGYFNVDGYSVLLKPHGRQYSEAFAGSGEFAAVMLVHAVTEAKEASLILLDEPEVSLHPGGQRQLMDFIRNQAKLRHHQFVISTHSPEMIRDLPSNAIKLFQEDPSDGRIYLAAQASEPVDAFFRLGVPSEISHSILVEDGLAAAILQRAIRPLGAGVYHTLKVTRVPGGASAITNLIPSFAALGENCLVFLDGDQRQQIPDPSTIPDSQLEDTCRQILGGAPKLLLHGGNDPNLEADKLREMRNVIDWMSSHVAYLPGDDPESLLLTLTGHGSGYTSGSAKEEWVRLARIAIGRPEYAPIASPEILVEQERALASLLDDIPELQEVRERVKAFLESVGI